MLNKKQEAGDKPTSCGTHERIRTSGLLLRRQSLYPTELLGHNLSNILTHFSAHCKCKNIILLFYKKISRPNIISERLILTFGGSSPHEDIRCIRSSNCRFYEISQHFSRRRKVPQLSL